MNTTLVFAGGAGRRMNSSSKPKQFLEIHGKPIIIYTLEHFERHKQIDSIVIVCIREWIGELKGLISRYGIKKVHSIVPGGGTGHDSIYQGLISMREFAAADDIILIHDGVRPLVTEELITRNIEGVKSYGNAITCEAARESVIRSKDGKDIADVPCRDEMYVAKAPQSFYYAACTRNPCTWFKVLKITLRLRNLLIFIFVVHCTMHKKTSRYLDCKSVVHKYMIIS